MDKRGDAGSLVENFVFNEVKSMDENIFVNFWRTTAKAEVDFLLTVNGELVSIEVNYGVFNEPNISRSFISSYRPSVAMVVTKIFWGDMKIGRTKISSYLSVIFKF